jgi:hypothetical protein
MDCRMTVRITDCFVENASYRVKILHHSTLFFSSRFHSRPGATLRIHVSTEVMLKSWLSLDIANNQALQIFGTVSERISQRMRPRTL